MLTEARLRMHRVHANSSLHLFDTPLLEVSTDTTRGKTRGRSEAVVQSEFPRTKCHLCKRRRTTAKCTECRESVWAEAKQTVALVHKIA